MPHTAGNPLAPASPPRQQTIPRRPSFGRSLRESGLPEPDLEALDAKRRQLDDSIWKYIASKEREYKNFEKELKHQRRASQGQNGEGAADMGRKRKGSVEKCGDPSAKDISSGTLTSDDKVARSRTGRETMERSSIAGLKDHQASMERDKDFVGVFTPDFLPALSDEPQGQPATLERASSNPEALLQSAPSIDLTPGSIERNNSDSLVHTKKNTRPSQLVLQHRTSSSGSSADGRLASAMKSPAQRSKRKRVSLAVGDAIVAPSDNVPIAFSVHSTPSHSRIRQAATPQPAIAAPSSEPERQPLSQSQKTSVANAIMQAEQTAAASAKSHHESEEIAWPPPKADTERDAAPPPDGSSTSSKLDPDGDLFDLDQEDDTVSKFESVDSDDAAEASEHDPGHELNSTSATSNPIFTPSSDERYDATVGMIPKPRNEPDTAVPYLASLAQMSQTPSEPGFRRPSVVADPVFKGPGYAAAEEEAAEDETYGSSYARPPSKGSFTSGSLGESFMERNAAQMSRMREERQQRTAQVRS